MSKGPPRLEGDCRAVGRVLARVGDKWAVLLMSALGNERMRFKDLHQAVPGISQRMLTVTLRNLEYDGLVIRTIYATIPPRVEYELSERGHSLKRALKPLGEWAMENQPAIEETRRQFEERCASDPAAEASLTVK